MPSLPAPPHPEPRQIGRRSLAKGAAWSMPVVALAVPAPAVAASPNTVYGVVCAINYGSYDGMTGSRERVWFNVVANTSDGIVPVGTQVSWTICVTTPGGVNYTTPLIISNAWLTQTLSPASGTTRASGSCFTYTVTFLQAYKPGCGDTQSTFGLEWSDGYPIPDRATVTVTGGTATGGTLANGGSMSLSWTGPNRNQNPGRTNLEPHYYLSKGGNQPYWPSIGWSTYDYNQQNGEDNVTCYPAGTTVIPTTERCTWDEPTGTCVANPSGLCSPKFTNTSNGGAQWVQPKI